MPRSSRHKSHKQSKHSSKEAKDYYSDSDEDVRMKEKERSSGGGGSVRVSKDSSHLASGEKRKLSSSSLLKEARDGKDLSGNGNGGAMEEYASSKRRKDKAESGGGDRWHGGGDAKEDGGATDKEIKNGSWKFDSEKGTKSKESKGLGDSKNKSSKRHESGGEKEEKNVGLVEKEEGRGGSGRGESRRKSEKESGRKEGKEARELKEKDRGSEREKKGQESKRDSEVRSMDSTVLVKKQGSHWEDGGDDRQGKRGRENNELPIQDNHRNLELEKELEKRIQRRRDGSGDRDKVYDVRVSDEKHISSRGDRSRDGRYKDDKYKDGSYGDNNEDEVDKDDRHRDMKYREDADKEIKYREHGDRGNRYRDDKYRDDGEKDNRKREDKYREDGDRDTRRKDDRDDVERDGRRRDDKYREEVEKETKRRDDKYREDGDRNGRRSDERHYEDVEKDDRYRDDKYREDSERYKEDKRREDYERDIRHKEGKQGDDVDSEKRLRDNMYKDEPASRDRTGDKFDVKHSRDEVHATDHSLKSSTRDVSSPYDDRSRLKDDQGRKRKSDKEDHGDVKSRSAKDQRYDSEKRSASTVRVDLTSERGRSISRNTDLEVVPNRSRHQGSPNSGSHVTREHHRVSKQDESKYREYAYEERSRYGVSSARDDTGAAGLTDKGSSRVLEKNVQKDDSHLLLSAERRPKTDFRSSPRQLIDKSPSSLMDRRHASRSDVRRSIDIEEFGHRSGGSRDAKDFYGKEGRGNRELSRDTLPGDDLSQTDGENLNVSSPFVRTGHFTGTSKSLVPPPFRRGVDSPSNFGSSEDDSRMKFNNRYRRMSDSNVGRVQGSPWKGVPSWPSPMANGFIPFQHGPPPVGLHHVMPHFPPGPLFGVRPSMELNHHGVPYHIPDAERFTGPGRPMGWRMPLDDPYHPPLHVWDANNAPFADEPHVYGRPDWDYGRTLPGGRGWETSGDVWKGPKGDSSTEMPFTSEKETQCNNVPVDVSLAFQSAQQTHNEEIQTDLPTENTETMLSSDVLEKKCPENAEITPPVALFPKDSETDSDHLCHVYLSKLDISADLADPELYTKCTALVDVDQKIISDAEDKILNVEEVAEAKIPSSKSSALLFATINDSVFQKAMTLYKKQREEFVVISGENPVLSKLCVKTKVESHKAEQLLPVDKENQAVSVYSNCDEEVKQPVCEPKLEEFSVEGHQELDKPVGADVLETPEKTGKNEGSMTEPEFQEHVLSNSVPQKDVLPSRVEEVTLPTNLRGNRLAGIGEEGMLTDIKYDTLLLSDVSTTKACEAVMPESIESGLVNLSRIHHSPESTH